MQGGNESRIEHLRASPRHGRLSESGGRPHGLQRLAGPILRSAAALVVVSLALVANSGVAVASGVTKTVITDAEFAGSPPNYIFPFSTLAYFSIANGDFEYMLYRPLYWFGTGSAPKLNGSLSLAQSPVASNGDRTFKITLKPYKWSNGTSVTSTDVLFWMNIWRQKPTGYAGWFPGGLSLPTSLKSFTVTSKTKFTMTFTRRLNPHWLLYNELSEITPLPLAWTRTSLSAAPGSGGCATAAYGTADVACKAVYVFLSEQSGFDPTRPSTAIDALPTYDTNPLWRVVDGPWYLSSFGATAPVTFKANPDYSGPNKPTYRELILKPFTTEASEYAALVGGTVEVGVLPATEVTSPATPPSSPSQNLHPGANNPRLASSFNLDPVYRWGYAYVTPNFNSTGDHGVAGHIIRQLYFRQALQALIDQPLYIKRLYKGYAVPTYGPVPIWPKNPYASKAESRNPYPYDPAKATRLLRDHGWRVVPGGTDTCQKPGSGRHECGAGIKRGAKLSFTLQYTSGTKALGDLMDAERSSWASAGIHVVLSSASSDTVLGKLVPCPKGCSWELEDYGLGWIYYPDFYPTGEETFASGASSNAGLFDTERNDRLIFQTDTTRTSLTAYENWLAQRLPVVWEPQVETLYEFHKGITHRPMDPLQNNTPATWHWS